MSRDDALNQEDAAGIMLVESEGLTRRVPGLLDSLDEGDRSRLLSIGRPVVFERDEPVWQQGD
jgi:hypothetical protein